MSFRDMFLYSLTGDADGEKFARMAVCMFKPFASAEQLRATGRTWDEELEELEKHCPPRIKRHLQNLHAMGESVKAGNLLAQQRLKELRDGEVKARSEDLSAFGVGPRLFDALDDPDVLAEVTQPDFLPEDDFGDDVQFDLLREQVKLQRPKTAVKTATREAANRCSNAADRAGVFSVDSVQPVRNARPLVEKGDATPPRWCKLGEQS
jgi:hypothetical protein